MKVIATSNHGKETIAEVLMKDHLTKAEAHDLADRLNEGATDDTEMWHVAVPDDHRLWRGMEELV
jgi:hypothetical protein